MSTIYRNKFRYNEKNAMLEYGYVNGGGEFEAVDAIGLSYDNWKEDNDYWLDLYQASIDEELQYIMD